MEGLISDVQPLSKWLQPVKHKKLGFAEKYRHCGMHLASSFHPAYSCVWVPTSTCSYICSPLAASYGNYYLSAALAEGLLKVRWIICTKFLLRFCLC